MSIKSTYRHGREVLGADVGSFVPWLGIVGKLAGGLTGGGAYSSLRLIFELSF